MNIQDPISDMLTRIRNAASRFKTAALTQTPPSVTIPHSKLKENILSTMKEEGYILDYRTVPVMRNNEKVNGHFNLLVDLKFHNGEHVISHMKAVSKPSLRVYKSRRDLPYFKAGMGTVIVSTSKGVMTAKKARRLDNGYGGEVLVEIF